MAKTSAVPPADKIFAGKVFVLQGDFGRFPRTHLNIARLIARHGGRVDSTVTDRTTLLVTTIEEFQKRSSAIEKAISLGKARCRIVQWDYVEDSIFTKNGKPRVISANFHEIQSVLKRQNRLSEAKAIYKKTFIKDANSMKGLADPGLHHVYVDTTAFKYLVVLSCLTKIDSKTRVEKYTLLLFESNASPYTYTVGAKFNRPGAATTYIKEYMVPSTFDVAFRQFRKFFRIKAGIDWDCRLDGVRGGEEAFVYVPPVRGEPRGVMPKDWKEPESNKPDNGLDKQAGSG
ncbi:hypothetical protein VC83_02993 [Pseudogymnoascus destructans]|uniref:Uncharacterized protein n=2 Tax=Pseudogymnoascus destructans TaxID=655981 RepID=L8GBH2_PSED2|nr:uncharacterized protein VC83_02993 [Pseudogymnoascus destructans]ELR10209.1 hypothetical protein GMDG_04602 [Pseudogymnoascus destructans 20631-21]OAF60057.1 hypothetical protein VC83_02993 [Pseudogymnoascus destructans]